MSPATLRAIIEGAARREPITPLASFGQKRLPMRLLLGLLLLVPATALAQPASDPATNAEALVDAIDRILDQPAFADAHWGAQVVDLASGAVLFERSAERRFMLASNQKLLTTAAALDRLGPDFVYRTGLWLDGPVVDGVLQGHLVVRGSGDPTIGKRFVEGQKVPDDVEADPTALFRAWADTLKALGITRVAGHVIGDDDAFDDVPLGNAWAWDDQPFYYAAEIGALQFNEGLIDMTVRATSPGQPAAIAWEPLFTDYIIVDNQSLTTARGTPYREGYHRALSGNTVTVTSTLPAGRSDDEGVAVHDPTRYFVHTLRLVLRQEGVGVEGDALDADHLPAPLDYGRMRRAALYTSPPLRAIVEVVNENSNNLYAEHLLKTMGARAAPPLPGGVEPGSAYAGVLAMRPALSTMGADTLRMRLADGSGLSYKNVAAPADLVAVLGAMQAHADTAVVGAFWESLPRGGEEGTLKGRYRTGAAAGRVRAKTGFITGARTLSGYVDTAGGRRLAFSLLCNQYSVPTREVNDAQDAVVELLAAYER